MANHILHNANALWQCSCCLTVWYEKKKQRLLKWSNTKPGVGLWWKSLKHTCVKTQGIPALCKHVPVFYSEMNTLSLMWYKTVTISEYDSMAAADCKTLALVSGAALCVWLWVDVQHVRLGLCPVFVPFVLMKCDSRLSFLRTCIHLLSSTRTDAAPIRVRQADCIKLKSSMDQVTCASVCVFVCPLSTFSPLLCRKTESYFLWFT